VLHEPKRASGGHPSQQEIGAFLRSGAEGPEHQALLRLIGSLIDVPPASYSDRRHRDDPERATGGEGRAILRNAMLILIGAFLLVQTFGAHSTSDDLW
jgi:hypothetical protein